MRQQGLNSFFFLHVRSRKSLFTYNSVSSERMKLFLSLSTSIIAIIIAIHQQPPLLDYMRGILRPSTINSISKTLQHNSSKTLSTMPSSTFVGLPVIPPQDPSLNAVSPKSRGIQQVLFAREQAEGAGATVRRSIGTPKLRNFTPFLMLDCFNIGPGAGFPDHPHRGQETITYLIEGAVAHEDFLGRQGKIYAGDLQFMTAGKGIVHAEMPHDDGVGSPVKGMQLWVDLPKHLKDCEPRYRDLRAEEIPTATADDGKVNIKVISGQSQGVDSLQELAYTPVWLLDVTIQPGGRLVQPLPAAWNSFSYTFEGSVAWDTGATKQEAPQHHIAVFEQSGDQVIASVSADAKEPARLLIAAGLPLDQEIVQYGPFVLNDASGVRKALMDYSTFSNGFERANGWASEIGKTMI